MKMNDQATLDIAATVMDVVEGKVKKEEAKYPHDMFHSETGEKKVAKTEKDHKELSDKGYTHDKPKNESPEEPRAKGEKDFKALHKVKSSGEKDMDGTVVKEAIINKNSVKSKSSWEKALAELEKMEKQFKGTNKEKDYTELLNSLFAAVDDWNPKAMSQYSTKTATKSTYGKDPISDLRYDLKNLLGSKASKIMEVKESKPELSEEEKYKEFFAKALKKFGAESPAELDKEKRKEFFNYVDKNYKAKNEDVQEDVRDMKNYDDRNRRGFEARASIVVVKGNTSNKFDDDFGFNKAEMTVMDKVISKIKKMHVTSFDGGSSGPASLEFYGAEASLTKFLADRNVKKIIKKYKAEVNGPTLNK
jgi:hypothetical protein